MNQNWLANLGLIWLVGIKLHSNVFNFLLYINSISRLNNSATRRGLCISKSNININILQKHEWQWAKLHVHCSHLRLTNSPPPSFATKSQEICLFVSICWQKRAVLGNISVQNGPAVLGSGLINCCCCRSHTFTQCCWFFLKEKQQNSKFYYA